MAGLNRFWQSFIKQEQGKPSNLLLNQVKMIVTFSLIGISALLLFGWVNISEGNSTTGFIEMLLAIAFLGNLFFFRLARRISWAGSGILIVLGAALLFLLYNGGIEQTGIFWFYTFPGAALFLKGKRQGVVWIAILFILTIGILLLGSLGYILLLYSFVTIRQLLASLLVVTLTIYFYENINENDQFVIQQHNQELQDTTKALQYQVKTLQAIKNLQEQFSASATTRAIMESFIAIIQQLFPTVSVSYALLAIHSSQPLPVYVYAAHTIGDTYLTVIHDDILAGIMPLFQKENTPIPTLDLRFIKGGKDPALAAFAASHLNLFFSISQESSGIINLASVQEGLFTKENNDIAQALVQTTAKKLASLGDQIKRN